jgi:predicted RNA-binding protein Jag
MKSVVQEASTIGKAIEQGWKTAGEPRNFSIKILEIPQHNFLGFSTKSAKVAIVFDENAPREGTPREKRELREREQRAREPRRDSRERGEWRDSSSGPERPSRERPSRDNSFRDRERSSRDESSRDGSRTRDRRDRYQSRDQRDSQRDSRDSQRDPQSSDYQHVESQRDTRETYRSTRPSIPDSPVNERLEFSETAEPKKFITPTNSVVADALAPQQNQNEESSSLNKQLGQWDDELVASAKKWLTETFRLMGLADVKFTIEQQNFHLRITLSKPLIEDETKEKHLFASLSTLMIASLKKEFRKALRGHKIVIVHG